MARTEGSLNKSTIVKTDSEDIFLSEALAAYCKWKAEAARLKALNEPYSKEQDYAEAYRVLFHNFSKLESNE